MNHRTQNHSGALKAPQNDMYQVANCTAVVQMPINNHTMNATLADRRVGIQMTDTVVQMPSSQQSNYSLDADLADRRIEIQRDNRLKFTLQEWENTLQKALVTIYSKRTGCVNVKNELYQLVGFYIVFQGVVLTAVAQGSLLSCQTCWGPAALSLLASIATVPAVHDRLKEYGVLKKILFWEIEDSSVITEKIEMLKRKGASFDFVKHAGVQEESSRNEEKKRQLMKVQSRKDHIIKWLTTSFLCVFSSIILSCCYIIPCWGIIDNVSTK